MAATSLVWCATVACVLIASLHAAVASAASRSPKFEVPDAALVRPLGQIARVPCVQKPPSNICAGQTGAPVSGPTILPTVQTGGLGIPLGGVGAGSFMVNQTGTFGPWNFGGSLNPVWEMRALRQAAFHLREQHAGSEPNWRTLATPGPQEKSAAGFPIPQRSWESVLPAWRQLEPGDGTYSALYPFGWMEYKNAFRSDASLRFFSPLVAKEDRRSSLPLAYFDFRVANTTRKPGKYTVMFTMPNAPAHVPNSWGQKNTFDEVVGRPSVRKGFSSRFVSDKRTGVKGVTLSADSPENTPDAANSEWTVAALPAAGQKVSYTTSFNAEGDGADVYKPFTESGRLPNGALDESHSAGALAVELLLRPGESQVVRFALAWDFPQVSFVETDDAQGGTPGETVWMRRYTNFYGARTTDKNDYVKGSYPFHQSFEIARDALAGHDDAVAAVERWWTTIANETAYPEAIRMGALNELYQFVFNNSFWEGGLVSNEVKPTGSKRLGTLFPGQHMFANIDGGGGGAPNFEVDVDSFGYDMYQHLFPSIDKEINRGRAEQVIEFPEGDPFKNLTDVTLYSPFVTWDTLVAIDGNKELEPAAKVTGRGYRDSLGKSIFRAWAYFKRTGDEDFLRWIYPAMVKQLKAIQKWDVRPGDHLPTDSIMFSSGYDAIVPNGHGIYNGGLYLLSLAVLEDAATRLGRPKDEIEAYKTEFALGRAQFEQIFWVPARGYYRFTDGISPNNLALFLDSFYAQHLAEKFGLPDLVDTNRYREHLKTAYSKFVGRRDRAGRLLGAPNIAYLGEKVGIYQVFESIPDYNKFCQATEACYGVIVWEADAVWTGTNYVVGATYVTAGRRFGDEELIRMGTELANAVAVQNWEVDTNGFQFNSPGWWLPHETTNSTFVGYKWALGIWDALDAIKPLDIPDPVKPSRKCASRRKITVNLRGVRNARVRSVAVYINGKLVKTQRSASKRVTIRLAGRSKETSRVRFVVTTRGGRKVVDKRTYHPCTKRR